jgi:predicted SnoaL-like aldol condensation-catalyzing enzyme
MKRRVLAALTIGAALYGSSIGAQQTTPAEAPHGNDFHVYFTEGDQVVKIAQRWSPDPDSAGSFYETFEWDQKAARVANPSGVKVPAAGCTATPAQIEANKRVANEFWRTGITPPERIGLVDAGYVQHNPFIRRFARMYNVTDHAALTFFATRGGTQGAPPSVTTATGQTLTSRRSDRTVAACDVVMQIHRGYVQMPQGSGNWIEQLGWDLFRVRDNKLVEHWDGSSL